MLRGNKKYVKYVMLALLLLGAVGFAAERAFSEMWSQGTWGTTVYYLATFEADDAADGTIRIAAVNAYELYFNGEQVGADSLWTEMQEYPVQVAKSDNFIAVKVTNKGMGDGSGLIVDLEAGELKVISTSEKSKLAWYWLGTEPQDEDWTTISVSKATDKWLPVQVGNADRTKISGLRNLQAEVISGFPGGVDVAGDPVGRITLKRVQGENLALNKPTNEAVLTDGSLETAWNLQPNSLNETRFIDLQERRTISKVRVLTKGTKLEDWQNNSLRGYSIQISDDRFKWTEVGVLHGIAQYDVTEVAFRPMKTRYVRLVVAEVDGVSAPKVAEIEVLGEGFASTGAFVSEPLDLGEPDGRKNFGLVIWDPMTVPRHTTLSIQFRTGNDTDSWSAWSEEYTEQDKNGEGGIFFSPPEPRKLVQYKLNFSTEDDEVTSGFSGISFEYSPDIAASDALGRISPTKVKMGEDTKFTYVLDLSLSEEDSGVKKLRLSTPSVPQINLTDIEGLEGVGVEDIKTTSSALEISFTQSIGAGDKVSQVVLPFSATLYGNAHEFRAYLYSPTSSDPLNVQENAAADTAGVQYSWSVFATDVMKETLSDVKANPRVISPNTTPGVCDFTVIEFTIAKLGKPEDVEIQIFDLTGTVIKSLPVISLRAGKYVHPLDATLAQEAPGYWDGRDDDDEYVPPGIYLYQVKMDLKAGTETEGGTVVVAY